MRARARGSGPLPGIQSRFGPVDFIWDQLAPPGGKGRVPAPLTGKVALPKGTRDAGRPLPVEAGGRGGAPTRPASRRSSRTARSGGVPH